MKVSVVPGRGLASDLVERWRGLQATNPHLSSPFFCPEFTAAIAEAREDVEVAIIEDGGKVGAFLPFQRTGAFVAGPVGMLLSDYHGFICGPEFVCDPREVLTKCGLKVWEFDHLIANQTFLSAFHHRTDSSPVIDLQHGFDAYLAQCHAARSQRAKLRRLEQALGPVRMVAASRDERLLEQVLKWKSGQYLKSRNRDLFAVDWIVAAIRTIHGKSCATFSGILSLLYAGDELVAGHFGMRAGSVWHYWFPAYAPERAQYSPGLSLLLRMAQTAPDLDLGLIDLGKGRALYKERFKNGEVLLAEGCVEVPSLLTMRRQLHRKIRSVAAKGPLAKPTRSLVNHLRQLRDRSR